MPKDNLGDWLNTAITQINQTKNPQDLENLRVQFLGKKGYLTNQLKELSQLEITARKQAGQELNTAKQKIQELIAQQKQALASQNKNNPNKIDISLPARAQQAGSLHPITQVRDLIEKIFTSLGFSIAEGPEIEDEFHNFTALNIPEHHPARAEHDTFYFKNGLLLRTHTSPVQIRAMTKDSKMPIRLIAPGRVYRCDYDLTHTPMFHQVEGLMIDENINFAHLKEILAEFMRVFFNQKNLKVRFRPSYFPFTEPSAEMDMSCVICNGTGTNCRVCSNTGWLEILGCGMVHPNVLNYCKIDPEKYTGWAFGIGIDRLAMLKFNIPDLRLMFENDLRFLEQF